MIAGWLCEFLADAYAAKLLHLVTITAVGCVYAPEVAVTLHCAEQGNIVLLAS
jgi:hypothetical protein